MCVYDDDDDDFFFFFLIKMNDHMIKIEKKTFKTSNNDK